MGYNNEVFIKSTESGKKCINVFNKQDESWDLFGHHEGSSLQELREVARGPATCAESPGTVHHLKATCV